MPDTLAAVALARSAGRRARPVAKKALVMDALAERVWPLLATGAIRPVIEAVLPVQRADEAHRLIAANETVGKVVLAVA